MPAVSEAEARARAALIAIDSYELFLDLSGASPAPVRSRVTVTFRCAEPGAVTFADVRAAIAGRAVLNGVPLGDPVDGRLELTGRTGLAARNTLTVEATAPRDQVLTTFTDPADGAEYVQVACYPAMAPDLFCCFHQPDLPGAVSLSVAVPDGWECVANGAVAGVSEDGGARVWRFATVPMKPMELALAAGPFTGISPASGRVAMSVRCRASLAGAETGHLERFGEVARRALEGYEERLGVPCPYDKYDIVFLPELAALAISVPGLMLVRESLLERMADPDDEFVAMIAAHEVAHLWFGCLVGTRWWDDLWLDEAMATYLSYTADTDWAAFSLRSKADAFQVDGLPGTPPVASPVTTMAEALDRPPAITYSKGAALVRQLSALIGDAAVDAGLTEYLRGFARGGTACTDDLVGCWSRAAGRDLSGWARQWLRAAGTPTLRAELGVAPDGTVGSLAVGSSLPREQWVSVGLFDMSDRDGGPARLRPRRLVGVKISGTLTAVPGLAGEPVPDALILNAGDRDYGQVTLDDRTISALFDARLDVGDPLTEAACWNAAWHMVLAGELAPADFAALVARRLGADLADGESADSVAPLEPSAAEVLLERAVACADRYAPRDVRVGLRELIAEAAESAARRGPVAAPLRRMLLAGFAASAESDGQLALLRGWLDDGTVTEAALRGKIVATLSARGLAGDADIDALAAADPVAGEATALTCRALRPDPASKDAAWRAALDERTSGRLAMAHAEGVWAPGQQALMTGYLERYFGEALPALSERDARGDWTVQYPVRRLVRLLFPAFADPQTSLEATSAALAPGGLSLSDPIRTVLLAQQAGLRVAAAARTVPAKLKIIRKRSGNR